MPWVIIGHLFTALLAWVRIGRLSWPKNPFAWHDREDHRFWGEAYNNRRGCDR
jgi:hypothetical protein